MDISSFYRCAAADQETAGARHLSGASRTKATQNWFPSRYLFFCCSSFLVFFSKIHRAQCDNLSGTLIQVVWPSTTSESYFSCPIFHVKMGFHCECRVLLHRDASPPYILKEKIVYFLLSLPFPKCGQDKCVFAKAIQMDSQLTM